MGEAPSRVHRVLSYEKGFLLWLPSTLVAACLVLFAIHQVPSAPSAFQAPDLRVALGPVQAPPPMLAASAAFEIGLRRGLRAQSELTLVDPQRVRERIEEMLAGDASRDPRSWIRATRSLDVAYCLAARLEGGPQAWSGELHVWEVAGERRVHSLRARAATPEALGHALGDSVGVTLLGPGQHAQALR